MKFFGEKIWWDRKKVVTLHSQTGSNEVANQETSRMQTQKGAVVQPG